MHVAISSLKQRAIASTAGLVVVASVLAPVVAHAEDNGPSGVPGKSCAVVNDNGTVSQVPVGTHVGLFYCGRDGEWHVGWLVGELTVGDSGGVKGAPVHGTLPTTATSVRAQ